MRKHGWDVLFWLLVCMVVIQSVLRWTAMQELTGVPWWFWIGSK